MDKIQPLCHFCRFSDAEVPSSCLRDPLRKELINVHDKLIDLALSKQMTSCQAAQPATLIAYTNEPPCVQICCLLWRIHCLHQSPIILQEAFRFFPVIPLQVSLTFSTCALKFPSMTTESIGFTHSSILHTVSKKAGRIQTTVKVAQWRCPFRLGGTPAAQPSASDL